MAIVTSNPHPLANRTFFNILEESNSVGKNTGWTPHHFQSEKAFLASYIKSHSYGEYIFDWAWAEFYQQNGIEYYPKLLHAIPFNPVNAPKFLGDKKEFINLAKESFEFYQTHHLSSEHYLFINDHEQELLEELGFTTQLTHQYHFNNNYESFEHYLSLLKKNKRKNIKKERKSIERSDLIIKQSTGSEVTDELLEDLHLFYLATIQKKGSYPYLTKKFFTSLKDQNILIISAQKNELHIAMALFFYDKNTLFGRNWGIHPKYESEYPNLHFELCYYQGMEFCFKNNLALFEAGAQGEHKLTRGFEPTIIKSAHHIKNPQCFDIIKRDIAARNEQTEINLTHLRRYLPFK